MKIRLINSRAAARRLSVSTETLHHLRCVGAVRAQQVTLRSALYDVSDLDAYAEANGQQKTYCIKGQRITVVYDQDFS